MILCMIYFRYSTESSNTLLKTRWHEESIWSCSLAVYLSIYKHIYTVYCILYIVYCCISLDKFKYIIYICYALKSICLNMCLAIHFRSFGKHPHYTWDWERKYVQNITLNCSQTTSFSWHASSKPNSMMLIVIWNLFQYWIEVLWPIIL